MAATKQLAVDHFDPRHITENDLDDLSSFFGMPKTACLERLRAFSVREMAQRWEAANPKTPEEILNFYRSADLYIWELMQWHASDARQPHWEALRQLVSRYPPAAGWRRVMDFGAGIGTDALFLDNRGYDVTLVDVDCPASRFARHRFGSRGLSARFVESNSDLPQVDGVYDIAVCFDVFEHLVEPLRAAKRIVHALRQGGLLVQTAGFAKDEIRPCHLETHAPKYAGVKWHIYLAGIGLRTVGPQTYTKCSAAMRMIQQSRFLLWRATGLWLSAQRVKAGEAA